MRAALAARPRDGVLLGLLHLVLGLGVATDPRTAHDEGLLMYSFARSLGEAFLPCLFFQKLKPALALLYLPVARAGFGPYLVAHVVVSAAAVALMPEIARALGHRRPWVPALVLALSPMYFWSGATGISNSDGIAGIVLFLYLLVVRRDLLWAGVLLGVLPWVRFEGAMFCAVMAPYVLYRYRSAAFAGGLCLWPLLYLGGGALYHRDALWFLHLSPGVGELMPGNQVWAEEFAHHGVGTAMTALAMTTPATALLLFVRPRRLAAIERALLVFAVGFLGLFLLTHFWPLPIGPAFALGFSTRYAVLPAAAVALLAGRAVEAQGNEAGSSWRDTLVLGVALALGALAERRGAGAMGLWAVAACGAVVAARRAGASGAATLALVALVIAAPLALRARMEREGFAPDPRLEQATAWIEQRRDVGGRAPIYTNAQMLPSFIARTGRLPGVPVRYMLAADQRFELTTLSNPDNGQREAVLAAVPRALMGEVVGPADLSPERTPEGALFVLIDDARTALIMPEETWRPRLRVLHRGPRFTIAALAPGP